MCNYNRCVITSNEKFLLVVEGHHQLLIVKHYLIRKEFIFHIHLCEVIRGCSKIVKYLMYILLHFYVISHTWHSDLCIHVTVHRNVEKNGWT